MTSYGLFVNDHRYFVSNEMVYSLVGYGQSLWRRYLGFCDRLCVVGRLEAEGSEERGRLSSSERVSHVLLPSLSGPFDRLSNTRLVRDKLSEVIAAADFVVVRLPSELGYESLSIARQMSKKIVIEVAGCPFDGFWNYGSFLGKLYAPIAFLRLRRAVRCSSNTLYVTESFLQRRYPTNAENIVAASNVELPEKSEACLSTDLRSRTGTVGEVIVGLIGTLRGDFKGIRYAIEAVSIINKTYDLNVSLRLLGDGPKGKWEKLAAGLSIRGLVHFDGVLASPDDVNAWLRGLDIYIQPSLKEGLPRALIEAMYVGLPALGSKVAGIPELLGEEFLVPPKSPALLAAKIVHLLNPTTNLEAIGARNQLTAQKYLPNVLESRRSKFYRKAFA